MSATVIILPVIRVERHAGVPVQGCISERAHRALLNLANKKTGGDLTRCVSDLLEHCADALLEESGHGR